MATNTPSASAFSNTPQAANDLFLLNEDTVSLAGGNILTLDVLANDAGGKAKQLWSLDDTALFAKLKTADTSGAWETTAGGNQMRISGGKVELNLSSALSNYGGSVQGLGAGEKITDSFYYTIRLANGTLSLAKADVTITGQNDAPTITSTARSLAFTEDAPAFSVVGKITATDADVNDKLAYSGNKSDAFGTFAINSNGVWSFQLNNSGAAVQSLAAGTTKVLTFPVTVSDGNGGTATQDVTVTITGTNDAPTISAASTATGSTAEDGTAAPVSGQIIASDIDSGATLTYSAAAKSSGAANFGSFTVDTTGKWSFDLGNDNDAVQSLAEGEVKTLIYAVTATDEFGASATRSVTIRITGTNDAPTVSADSVTSGDVAEDGTTATGQIAGTDVDNGATLTYSAEAQTKGSTDYGNFSVDDDGAWSFTLSNHSEAVQSLAQGETVELTYTVTVTDEHDATTTQDVTVTITGTNDAPVVTSAAQSGDVAEDGTLTVTGTVTATDIDNAAELGFSGDATGDYGSFVVDPVTGGWTYTLDNTAHQSLAEGETQTETFTVTVTDDKGGTATQDVTITITGTNDAPVITAADTTGAVTEDGTASATGQITASDVDNGAVLKYSVAAQTEGSADYGSFSVDASGKWSFTLSNTSATVQSLAQGDTVKLTYTVTVTDEHDATDTQDVTVTITGTNDAPVVTSAAQSGDVAEDGTLTVTGTVTATDIDHDAELGFSGDATGDYGSFVVDPVTGGWTYTLDNTAHQSLAEGETQTETFTVTVTDDKGGTATQDVTVTITGTNDAPVITAADTTGAVTEDGTASATGQITASDVDNGAVLKYSVAAQTEGSADYGSFSVDASGKWSFTLSNTSATVQSLAQGETAKLTYTVTVTDEHDATDTQDVTVTVTGTNDTPTITSAAQSGNVAEDGTASASGQIIASDVDTGATLTYSAEALNEANASYGSFSVGADGKWSFALANDSAAVQSLYHGATATLTYAVTVKDDHGATATQNVTVRIAGTNDAPTITSTATASVTEDGSITGQITATDVDRDSVTFATQGTVPAGFTLDANGSYSFDAGSYDRLGAGQTETVHVSVIATDTLANSAPQDLAITITGVNDAATITNSNSTAALVEDSTSTTSGRLTVTDADTGEAGFRTPASLAGTYGSFSFNTANGTWGYLMNNASAAVQGLNQNEQVTDSLTVQSTDGTSHVISVGITGRNDLPTFTNSNTAAEVTEDSATQTASGTLSVTDKDTGQSVFQTPASLAGNFGTFTFNASTGAWGYTLNNAAAGVQALDTGTAQYDYLTVKSLDNSPYTIGVKINGVNEPSAIPTTIGTVVTTSGTDPNDTNGTGPFGSASNGNDKLAGTNGADTLGGLSGDDTLYARNGDDVLVGGTGNDIIYASSGNDSVSGSDNNDLLYGGSGNDAINGGNGSDTIYGGFGADILTGGANDDRFVFEWENDRGDFIRDFNSSGTDKIDVSAIDANSASSGNQTFAWGGTGMAANGIWYVANTTTSISTFYADTDGNTDTAEFWFTANGTSFAATDFIL